MVKVTVSTKTVGAMRKLNKLETQIAKQGTATVDDLANLGKQFARSIVPVFNGNTFNLIKKFSGTDNKGPWARVQAQNSTKGGNNRKFSSGDYPNFNLVRWMHETKGRFRTDNPLGKAGTKHIKSGDPQFMYTTRDYLNGIKKKTATGRFKNINIR